MILIKTKIHESCNGHGVHTYFRFATGPRNLLKACRIKYRHSKEMTKGYGNIGHCGTWIEIDGIEILHKDLPVSQSEAKSLIEKIKSGKYELERKQESARNNLVEEAKIAGKNDGIAARGTNTKCSVPAKYKSDFLAEYEYKEAFDFYKQ